MQTIATTTKKMLRHASAQTEKPQPFCFCFEYDRHGTNVQHKSIPQLKAQGTVNLQVSPPLSYLALAYMAIDIWF